MIYIARCTIARLVVGLGILAFFDSIPVCYHTWFGFGIVPVIK